MATTKKKENGPFCTSCAEDKFEIQEIKVKGDKRILLVLVCSRCRTLHGSVGWKE